MKTLLPFNFSCRVFSDVVFDYCSLWMLSHMSSSDKASSQSASSYVILVSLSMQTSSHQFASASRGRMWNLNSFHIHRSCTFSSVLCILIGYINLETPFWIKLKMKTLLPSKFSCRVFSDAVFDCRSLWPFLDVDQRPLFCNLPVLQEAGCGTEALFAFIAVVYFLLFCVSYQATSIVATPFANI